jgi:hypothetical protein
VVKELPIFNKVCMSFYFKHSSGDPDTIIFTKFDQLFEFNFETEVIKTIYKFEVSLFSQPLNFVSNENQTIFCVSSFTDGVWINIEKGIEVDLDETYRVGCVMSIIFDQEEKKFYFLCNTKNNIIGFYLIKFDEKDPKDYQFICMWRHLLNIGNPNMFLMRG